MRFIKTTTGYINVDAIEEFKGIKFDVVGTYATAATVKGRPDMVHFPLPGFYLDDTVINTIIPAASNAYATVVTVFDEVDVAPNLTRHPIIAWNVIYRDHITPILPFTPSSNEHVFIEIIGGGYHNQDSVYPDVQSLIAAMTRKTRAA